MLGMENLLCIVVFKRENQATPKVGRKVPAIRCNTLKLLNDVLEQKITIVQEGKQVKISKKLAMLCNDSIYGRCVE